MGTLKRTLLELPWKSTNQHTPDLSWIDPIQFTINTNSTTAMACRRLPIVRTVNQNADLYHMGSHLQELE